MTGHYFRPGSASQLQGTCVRCGIRGSQLAGGVWMFIGPTKCPAVAASVPGCQCAAACGGRLLCGCLCHLAGIGPAPVAPGQLILPFEWDVEAPTPAMTQKCPDCGRDWCEALDHYAGTDLELAELCAPCRDKRERQKRTRP